MCAFYQFAGVSRDRGSKRIPANGGVSLSETIRIDAKRRALRGEIPDFRL
jgi:hypothetical protein